MSYNNYGGGAGRGYGAPGGGYGAPPGGGYGAGAPPGGGYGGAAGGGYGRGAPPPGGGYGAPPGGGYGGGGGVPPGYGQGPPPNQRPPGGPGGPGGFHAGSAPQAPPGYDPQEWADLWTWFVAVDTDHSGSIRPQELQVALRNGNWTPFDLDTVKMLMSIFDTNGDGHIAFNEFAGLWKYIKEWQHVYNIADNDNSGSIDGEELQKALRQFGFALSPNLILLVARKYEIKASTQNAVSAMPGDHTGTLKSLSISFDRFIRACVFVKQLTEAFRGIDTDHDGWIQINYEQFMEIVLKGP